MCTCGGDIRIDRRLQRLQGGKSLLFTQLVVELHRQAPAVKVAGIIQQMNLQMRAPITGNGGTHADIADTRPGLAVDLDAGQVDPGQRHAAALELDVGGRCAELAGQLLAMQHAAGDVVRAAQQVFGQLEVASDRALRTSVLLTRRPS